MHSPPVPNHSTYGRGRLVADPASAQPFSALVRSLEGEGHEEEGSSSSSSSSSSSASSGSGGSRGSEGLTDATIYPGPLVAAENDGNGDLSARTLPCTEAVVYDVGQVCIRYVAQCRLSFDGDKA